MCVCVCVCVCVCEWRWCPTFLCRTLIERCRDIRWPFWMNWKRTGFSGLVISHGYSSTAQTESQNIQWTVSSSPKSKKLRMWCSRLKTMMLFDTKCVVHHEYFPVGLTVKQYFYKDVVEHLREKWLELVPHYMTWHDSLSLIFIKKQFLPQNKITLVESAPICLVLLVVNFQFLKLKSFMKGTIWQHGAHK